MKLTLLTEEDLERLAADAEYRPRGLAALCGWSMRQLQRWFRFKFGRTPKEWLDEKRLLAACQQLSQGQAVKVVSLGLGYKQVSHFCRQFKSYKQLTPSQFVAQAEAFERCRSQITNVARR